MEKCLTVYHIVVFTYTLVYHVVAYLCHFFVYLLQPQLCLLE